MAYYTNIIALSIIEGQYNVSSQICTQINVRALDEDGLLKDVSENNYYFDEAAILEKNRFAKYLNDDNKEAKKWYKNLPPDVKLIIVNKLEWESGLGD